MQATQEGRRADQCHRGGAAESGEKCGGRGSQEKLGSLGAGRDRRPLQIEDTHAEGGGERAEQGKTIPSVASPRRRVNVLPGLTDSPNCQGAGWRSDCVLLYHPEMEGFRPENPLAVDWNSVGAVRLDGLAQDLTPSSSFLRGRVEFVCRRSSSLYASQTHQPEARRGDRPGRTSLLAPPAGRGKGTPHAETRRPRSSPQSARSPLLPSAISASPLLAPRFVSAGSAPRVIPGRISCS